MYRGVDAVRCGGPSIFPLRGCLPAAPRPQDGAPGGADVVWGTEMSSPNVCRLCGEGLTLTFVDLGMSPLCESYVSDGRLDEAEVFYPLHVRLCSSCLLVQLPAYVTGEQIFSNYAYFSSYSDSWVAH